MFDVEIEDKRMTKKFDISLVSHRTVEALLQFCGISPNATHKKLDMTLNRQRIEFQGAKPNKVKKTQFRPKKAENELQNDDKPEAREEEDDGEEQEVEA